MSKDASAYWFWVAFLFVLGPFITSCPPPLFSPACFALDIVILYTTYLHLDHNSNCKSCHAGLDIKKKFSATVFNYGRGTQITNPFQSIFKGLIKFKRTRRFVEGHNYKLIYVYLWVLLLVIYSKCARCVLVFSVYISIPMQQSRQCCVASIFYGS